MQSENVVKSCCKILRIDKDFDTKAKPEIQVSDSEYFVNCDEEEGEFSKERYRSSFWIKDWNLIVFTELRYIILNENLD